MAAGAAAPVGARGAPRLLRGVPRRARGAAAGAGRRGRRAGPAASGRAVARSRGAHPQRGGRVRRGGAWLAPRLGLHGRRRPRRPWSWPRVVVAQRASPAGARGDRGGSRPRLTRRRGATPAPETAATRERPPSLPVESRPRVSAPSREGAGSRAGGARAGGREPRRCCGSSRLRAPRAADSGHAGRVGATFGPTSRSSRVIDIHAARDRPARPGRRPQGRKRRRPLMTRRTLAIVAAAALVALPGAAAGHRRRRSRKPRSRRRRGRHAKPDAAKADSRQSGAGRARRCASSS